MIMVVKKALLIGLMSALAMQAHASCNVKTSLIAGAVGAAGTWLACHLLYTSRNCMNLEVADIEFKDKVQDLQAQLDAFSKKIVELEQEKKELELSVADKDAAVAAESNRVVALEQQITALKKERDGYLIEIENLSQQQNQHVEAVTE
jgi:septal ring factor EnvC (AmiA/AmiB activator)